MSDEAKEQMWRKFAWLDGWQDRMTFDRTEAFGAMRRAAEVARKAERDHASFYAESKRDLDDFGPGVERVFADGCRAAIRAAIGSPKR